MLLVLIISALTVSCRASPFHKYPFVFLLDIGNEELGKANAEQIKVSVPGGALAIKYPATGQGDIIGHVRVTGIDYGTDLKANIVEGGPGYRYVVLVFMGNSDVEYDAVVTIQTLSDDDVNTKIGMSSQNSYEVKENQDLNNSAEEIDDDAQSNSVYSEKMNAEFTQSSSNVYRYVNNENMEVHSQENISNDDDDHGDDDDDDDEMKKEQDVSIDNVKTEDEDLHVEQDEIDTKDALQQSHNEEHADDDDDDDDDDDTDDDTDDKVSNLSNAYIVSSLNSVPQGFSYPVNVNNEDFRENSNPNPEVTYKLVGGLERFFALKPRFYGRVYPQVPVPEDRSYIDHSEDDDNRLEGQAKDANNNVNDYNISPVDY